MNQAPSSSATSSIISSPTSTPGAMQVSTTAAPTSSTGTAQDHSKKRKRQPPSAISLMRRKKIKTTIIDCPAALTLLKELGLNRSFFNSGTVLAWALEPTDPAFIRIHDYVSRGQNAAYGVKVVGLLQIMTKMDHLQNAAIPSDFNENPRNTGQLRKMLWHGTDSANVAKILQNGLKLPKHDKPNMYGKGIYFADRIDLSLVFCNNWRTRKSMTSYYKSGNTAYLFLCDVLLGNDIYKTRWMTSGNKIRLNWPWQPSKILTVASVLGRGLWIPNPLRDQVIDGCVWPMGEAIQDPSFGVFLLYRNIYVVYNEMRVIPKYLVKVEFTEKPVFEKLY